MRSGRLLQKVLTRTLCTLKETFSQKLISLSILPYAYQLWRETLYNQYYNDINPTTYENYESHANPNEIDEHEQMSSDYIWSNTATYKESFGKHNLTVFAGYEQKYSRPLP